MDEQVSRSLDYPEDVPGQTTWEGGLMAAREYKVEKIEQQGFSFAKDWGKQVQALEVDGWRVMNLQQAPRSFEILVWMVRP